jgi:hypothetical protein
LFQPRYQTGSVRFTVRPNNHKAATTSTLRKKIDNFLSPKPQVEVFVGRMAVRLKPLLSLPVPPYHFNYSPRPFGYFSKKSQPTISASKMATSGPDKTAPSPTKIIDSHLHVWASPQEVKLTPTGCEKPLSIPGFCFNI